MRPGRAARFILYNKRSPASAASNHSPWCRGVSLLPHPNPKAGGPEGGGSKCIWPRREESPALAVGLWEGHTEAPGVGGTVSSRALPTAPPPPRLVEAALSLREVRREGVQAEDPGRPRCRGQHSEVGRGSQWAVGHGEVGTVGGETRQPGAMVQGPGLHPRPRAPLRQARDWKAAVGEGSLVCRANCEVFRNFATRFLNSHC